ncbi:EamA family transporter [Chitinophaga vietnamensis]|uniref:EamA family transporter n=1 Tax=Chitinophaga vietnamensis TaxID=2593957 RepID=UPI001177F32F|nr:DMT family transporter [Chitinophaga vietnamensis]
MNRYIWMVFAGACSFGILSTFVKLAYRQGYTAAEISVSQAFTGMLALGLLALLFDRQPQPFYRRKVQWPLLFTGMSIGLTTFVYYVSVKYIPASVAIVILMQFTWIGILLDWLLFKKKPGMGQVLITGMILAGTALSGGFTGKAASGLSLVGIGYALLSALLYAIYIVANSRTGHSVHPLRKSAVMMCGATLGIFLVNSPVLLTSTHFNMELLKWALFLALFGTVIPPVLFAQGIPKTGAGTAAIVMTAELPVAVICSHLVLQEQVTVWQWVGVAVMLLSIALLYRSK